MNTLKIKRAILVIGDIALLYLSLALTLIIRYNSDFNVSLWQYHLLPFSILFAIWIIVFYINNLYTLQSIKNNFKFYSYLLQNLAINTLIGFAFFYLAPASFTSLKPLRVLILVVILFTFFFLLWRRLFYSLTSSKSFSNRTLFIGMNQEASVLMADMLHNPQYGYTPALILLPSPDELPPNLTSIPRIKEMADIINTIKRNRIQTVVTISNAQRDADISRYLFDTLSMGLSYYTFPDFYEKLTGKIPVASLEKSWFLENLLAGNKNLYEITKRIEDILFSIIFGIFSLCLVPFIIIGIKLFSPGPILFRQTRTGKGGKTFTAMKFRTMIVDAEKNGPQWAVKGDTRITKFGKFLRKTRLDEIPQFINIFKGDMTFVGPRPERPEFVSLLNTRIPYYKERLLVKPGLSGWAQINFKYGDSVEDAMTKLQYDLFYIKNRSFTLDLSIILKTISTVINATLGQ